MIHPDTGKLIIASGEATLVNISDNKFTPGDNLTATLSYTGNFKLKNETDNQTLWQSFDYPTNLLLPGMKIGVNLKTGQSWNLTSRLRIGNPDLGAFTLSWEPTDEASQRFMIRRRGQPYWTSGNLSNQISPNKFEFLTVDNGYPYNISYIYNNDEIYFTIHANVHVGQDGSIGRYPVWYLDPEGRLIAGQTYSVLTGEEFCYGYETRSGCVAGPPLQPCRSENDQFNVRNGDLATGMVYNTDDANTSLSLSFSDCMMKCWDDCSCLAINTQENGTNCVTWHGPKSTKFKINPAGTSERKYVLESQHPSKATTHIWAPIVTGIFLLSFCFGLLWYLKKRNLRLKAEERQRRDDQYIIGLMASDSFNDASNLDSSGRKKSEVMVFSYAFIVASTNDFASENKLGEGGFGPVYKGKLSDGRDMAIKRLSRASGQGLVEFKNELILITKLKHTNLVRVLGCCIHGEEKMLIYEYMPNKSLDFFLFDETKKTHLDWTKRSNIIEGIAQGMLYLHKYSRMRVIHRDLKASNVLLDVSMNPKISDFGMARIFKQHETEAMTNRVVGTYGYMAPEYAMEGTFSEKSDVFSFGVLTLEIVSGRRNTSFYHRDKSVNLIGYAWELWLEGDALKLEDPTLVNTHAIHQLLRTIHVALLCVQENASDRPVMSDILSMLNNDITTLPVPNQPTFFIGRTTLNSTSEEKKSNECSVNKMTVTVMEAR
ncbi:unnamed protein product [Lactuca virosa]|uniref:Receptor-like serine/threonine-protein kinase n=1 Tax=Lactuca virosa TaxID=75947 RepID=A0AAU9MNV5_9ASTR|nr:unnamed protein product [Lactuca virosa]